MVGVSANKSSSSCFSEIGEVYTWGYRRVSDEFDIKLKHTY